MELKHLGTVAVKRTDSQESCGMGEAILGNFSELKDRDKKLYQFASHLAMNPFPEHVRTAWELNLSDLQEDEKEFEDAKSSVELKLSLNTFRDTFSDYVPEDITFEEYVACLDPSRKIAYNFYLKTFKGT